MDGRREWSSLPVEAVDWVMKIFDIEASLLDRQSEYCLFLLYQWAAQSKIPFGWVGRLHARCKLRAQGDQGRSWLMHVAFRRRQLSQMTFPCEIKQWNFLRLHSQQLCVPLRTFLRLIGRESSSSDILVVCTRDVTFWDERKNGDYRLDLILLE